ncbi:hypothetical protein MMC26_006400 [Xylographa opegraphella]|nr:hypothetical protein [Xylographa opegraphella]
MSKARPDDLSYGHLGEANYDPKSEKWYFKRVPGIGHFWQPIGNSVVSLQSTLLNAPSNSSQSAISRDKHIRNLTRSEPSIAAAAFMLPSLAQVSETAIEVTATTDPITTRLLAFGTAADIENKPSGRRRIDVLAVVGGPAGEAIRILRVGKERFSWLGKKGVTLSVPAIDMTEQGWWVGNGTPIQQVCFSEEEGRPGSWLAVRYPGATSILRPLLRRQPVAAGTRRTYHALWDTLTPSRLDTNQIVHLNIEQTGGTQHTDVAFNPWNQRQFAVLDVRGHWSIWNIEGKSSTRNLWTVKCVSSKISSDLEDTQHSRHIGDGWGSILWVDDTTFLVVASRSNLFIYSTASKSERYIGPDLGLAGGSDWILAMQRSPVDYSHVFVLTSLCIYWLKLDSGKWQHTGSPSLEVLLARRHFRSREDRSLKMLLHEQFEGELHTISMWTLLIITVVEVMLQSSQTELVTVFKFSMVRSTQLPQSISDPFVVRIQHCQTDAITVKDASQASLLRVCQPSLATMLISSVPYTVPEIAEPFDYGGVLMDAGVRFLQAFILFSDFSISERLYASVEQGQELKGVFLPRRSLQHHTKTPTWTFDNIFIVEDGFAIDCEHTVVESVSPGPRRWALSHKSNLCKHRRNIDLAWLVTEIETGNQKLSYQSISAEDFVDYLQSSINNFMVESSRILSLYELIGNNSMSNIDNASGLLQEFVNGIHERNIIPSAELVHEIESDHYLRIWPLLTMTMANTIYDRGYDDQISLMPLYETLLDSWIKPLRSQVPGRARVSIEKRLRKISMQLHLSCHGLQYGSHVNEQDDPTILKNAEDGEFVLPLRRKASVTSLAKKGKERTREISPDRPIDLASQEFLPQVPRVLPTPELTPGLHSQPSVSSFTTPNLIPHQRLEALALINPQPPLSDSLTRILSHWSVGEDPIEYNWAETQKSLPQSDAAIEVSLRRQPRLGKRLRRQGQGSHGASSQQSSAWLFSSQPHTSQAMQSSSQNVEMPLRSRHFEQISRNAIAPKRRKPERKAGF